MTLNHQQLEQLISASRQCEEHLKSLAVQIENIDPNIVFQKRKDIGRDLRAAATYAKKVRRAIKQLLEN